MTTYTPEDVIDLVSEAVTLLGGTDQHITMTTIDPDGNDGKQIEINLADYVVWSVVSRLIDNGGDIDEAKIKARLKRNLENHFEEIDSGLMPSGFYYFTVLNPARVKDGKNNSK
jgi:hypothetical protein